MAANTTEPAGDRPVPRGLLFFYGLPAVGVGYMFLFMSLFLMKFATDSLLIAPAVMGARLIVEDRAAAEEWFLEVFDVEPDNRIVTDNFDEVFLKMGGGLFFALYEPKDEPPLPKSNYPVVAIYSTDYDGVLERIKALGLYVRERGDGLLFARDPSGNVVEVVRQTAR